MKIGPSMLLFVLAATLLSPVGLPGTAAGILDTTPPTGTIVINNNRTATKTADVTLALTWDDGAGGSGVSRMRFSSDGATWTPWEVLATTRAYTLPAVDGYKTIRVQYLDKANNRSLVYSDYIRLDTVAPSGGITINNGAATTTTRSISLKLNWSDTGSGVTRMRFSDNGSTWTAWESIKTTRTYTLPAGLGYHTVRVQYTDAAENYSPVVNDYIKLVMGMSMISVPSGEFQMGNSGAGADASCGTADELPLHTLNLSAYQIGRYEVTNRQFCDILNWALAQGLLKDSTGASWTGTGKVYAGAALAPVVALDTDYCNVQFSGGMFVPKSRMGLASDGVTFKSYATDSHPVTAAWWFSGAAFCNWLSQFEGLTPCYNMSAANWPLTTAPPASGGYRLPTEAEWERAAAWDGSRHWVFGFTSDTLTGKDRANYYDGLPDMVNPLGFYEYPLTAPVGWFNGSNISPNGLVHTLLSTSPVGAYDMSGNVREWCNDWYGATYYAGGSTANPTGPLTGDSRVIRGGAYSFASCAARTAERDYATPFATDNSLGFRVARTP